MADRDHESDHGCDHDCNHDSNHGAPRHTARARHQGQCRPLIAPVQRDLVDAGSAPRLLAEIDLVLDASDNFPTKYRVNAAAREAGIPAVIGGALRLDGQVFASVPGGACYRCVFANSPEPGEAPTCSSVGILGPVVGLVGLRQVGAAAGVLQTLDGRTGRWMEFEVGRRPDCVACGPERDEPWMR